MTLLTVNPTASAHDVREASGTMSLTSNVLTSGAHWVGLFLPSVTVPVGATINSATLYYKSVDAARVAPNIVWCANGVDDAAVFTTAASNVSSRAPTAASVTDSATGIGTTNYRTVTITSLIAEVTARGGWASGNDIALLGDCQAGCTLEYGHYDGGANVWYVEIDYTPGVNVNESIALGRGHAATPSAVAGAVGSMALGRGEAAAPGGPAATVGAVALGRGDAAAMAQVMGAAETLLAAVGRGLAIEATQPDGSATLQIGSGNDDGMETTGGTMALATAALDVDSAGDIIGLLFRGLNAPSGATILTAYIEVYPTDTGRQSPNVTIKGQYAPANFGTGTSNFSGRTMTTASASWVASNIGTGAYKSSPSLVALLQEIVSDDGWASGGNVALFLIQNSASGWLRIASYNLAPEQGAKLIVTWTSGAAAIEETLTLGRGGGVDLSAAAGLLAEMTLARGLAADTPGASGIAAAVALARQLTATPDATAASAAAVTLGRGEGVADTAAAGLPGAVTLGRAHAAATGATSAALGALPLGRGLGLADDAAAATAAAIALARQMGLSDAATSSALAALALSRALGVAPTPSAGVLVALSLGRAHGITTADGFTILEAVALGRALAVTTGTPQVGAAASITVALARAIAGDGRAAGQSPVTLAEGRAATFAPVTAGQEGVAIGRALGVGATAGMALWDAIALSTGRGVSASAVLGYLEAIALARRGAVSASAAIGAAEALLLAVGNQVTAQSAAALAEAVNLARAHNLAADSVAALLESIGIGIYRAVAANGTVNVILATPRHLMVVDAENRVTVIELDSRYAAVEPDSRTGYVQGDLRNE